MPVITLNIGPEIAKNNPVIPKFNTSLSVVIRCLLSNTSRIFSSNNYLSSSLSCSISYFTSSSASYNCSYTASRCIGSGSYSRAYTGVYCTCILFYNVKNHSVRLNPSTHTLILNRNLYY